MRIDPTTLLTILGMAAATYSVRVLGVWLAGRVALSRRVRAWLNALPGAILVSMVVPVIASGGGAEVAAAVATGMVAWRTGSLLPALVAGVVTVWLLRGILPA